MRRPTSNGQPHGQIVTTPSAAMMIQLLGKGHQGGPITVTRDQMEQLRRLYGFTQEPPTEKPPTPAAPQRADFSSDRDFEQARQKWEADVKALDRWTDPRVLLQAGADRNTWRHAEADGLRLIAWIAKHVTAGEDPLKLLVQLACDAGWDVDPADVSWAQDDEAEVGEDADDSEAG